MAYANYLAAVDWKEIGDLQNALRATIAPTTVVVVSHLYAHALKLQPLGGCLAEVLDGGQVLLPSLWHPLRVPLVHTPDAVRVLAINLRAALNSPEAGTQKEHVNDPKVGAVLRLLEQAARANLAVVSVLEPPADLERAQRVTCPFNDPEKLPVPWGKLAVTLMRFSKTR